MKHILFLLALSTTLAGCNSLIASATGPEPLGRPEGERTFSMRLEDSGIERTAGVNILKADKQFRDANVNVLSFYGNVLLVGQVQTEELKTQAEKIVRQIAEVKQVHNELTVEPASYYGERMSDGTITKRLETSFLLEKGFPAKRTKLITVAGTVYLMGKLTPSETDTAIAILSQTSGVKKIIKLVDTLPEPQKAESAQGSTQP